MFGGPSIPLTAETHVINPDHIGQLFYLLSAYTAIHYEVNVMRYNGENLYIRRGKNLSSFLHHVSFT